MSVKLRKSADPNRTKSLIEKPRVVSFNSRNNFKSGIGSVKSDAEQSKMTFQQKFINFFKKHFKRNRKQQSKNKYKIIKSEKIENVKSKKSKPLSQPRSLKNIGSNCYLNAALQGISSCRQFCNDISDLVTLYNDEIVNLRVFHDLLFHLNGGTFMSMEISRNTIFQNWNKSSQQDSFELLNYVLNEVYNEIRKYEENKRTIEENNYQQWLQIKLPMKIILNYSIQCECGSIEYSPPQSDLAFHLVIYNNKHDTIQNIFENFFQDELIDGYICNNNKCINNKAYKSVKLQQPIPKTICIHLQKSHFDGIKMRKIKDKIRLEKLLRIKRKFFSENKKNRILSEIENNELEKNSSFIFHDESDLNTEKIDLMENVKIIKTDENQTHTKKAEDVSNKEIKITDNDDINYINNYNNKTITKSNYQNLKIRDLRSRNSSFLLSLTNSLLSCKLEILPTDYKLSFDSVVNESLEIIKNVDKTNKLRDSEITNFFRSSVDFSEFDDIYKRNHVQIRKEIHSSESNTPGKRKAIYESGISNRFIDGKEINQNNEIISPKSILNNDFLITNPQSNNEIQMENYSKNYVDRNKTYQNNEIISSENLLNENGFTSNPENSNETQNENSSNNNAVEDEINQNFQNNEIISSETLLNEDNVTRKLRNSTEIQNKNDSNNNVVEDEINQNSQNNEIAYSKNFLNSDITSNCPNNNAIQNENSSNNNVVEGETDKNDSDHSGIFLENLMNKDDLNRKFQNSTEIQNKNDSNNNVVEDEINQNSQNSEILSSENLINEDFFTGNPDNSNEIQNENSYNNNVIESKIGKNDSNQGGISLGNLLHENGFISNPDNSNEIQIENDSNNNGAEDKINQNFQNNEILSSENLLNEDDFTSKSENLNKIQNENNSNINVEDKIDKFGSYNGNISFGNLLNDLINNPENSNKIQNKISPNNDVVEDKTDKYGLDNDSNSLKSLIKENSSNNNVIEEESNQNYSNNFYIISENLLNESDSTNNPLENEKFSNYVYENNPNQNSQNIDCIRTNQLENESTISQDDDTFYLKSIIVHLGSVNSGHYVCYKYFNNKWFLADDTRIHKVTEEEVLNSDAYILFYEKN